MHRSSDVPDTTQLTTKSYAAATHWEKRHFLQIQTARNAGRAACLEQALKGICELFTFLNNNNNNKAIGILAVRSQKEKYLNVLIAKVTKNAHKLSLKVDMKYVQQQWEQKMKLKLNVC